MLQAEAVKLRGIWLDFANVTGSSFTESHWPVRWRMTTDSDSPETQWTRHDLLGLQDLSAAEITMILDQAAEFKAMAARGESKISALNGTVVANLFFEPSTRTRTSFSLAAKRLSADTIDFTASASSLSKGETFVDTARNIEAMGVDLVVFATRLQALRNCSQRV